MSKRHSDSQDIHAGGIWRSLNRFLFALIVVAVATIAGYRFLPEFTQRDDQERQLETLETEINKQQQLLARHQLEEALIQSEDPEFLGIHARDFLNLRKPGETIFRLEQAHVDTSRMRRNE